MQLQQIRSFVAVAEHGSFTQAAAALYVAQPSVSQQVRQLEAELGVQLFDRSNRRVKPTEIGKRLLQQAREILAHVTGMEREADDYTSLAPAILRIGMSLASKRMLLANTVRRFSQQYSDISIEIVESGSSDIADMVRKGTLDLGLVTSSPLAPNMYQDFDAIPVADAGVIACCTTMESPLAKHRELHLSSLRNQRVIGLPASSLVYRLVCDAADWDLPSKTICTTDNAESARYMVAAGVGVLFTSHLSTVPDETSSQGPGIAAIPLSQPRIPLGLTAITYGRRYTSRTTALFLESLDQATPTGDDPLRDPDGIVTPLGPRRFVPALVPVECDDPRTARLEQEVGVEQLGLRLR